MIIPTSTALLTSMLMLMPTSGIAHLEMLPSGLVIQLKPQTFLLTPLQLQTPLSDDFWFNKNIINPDFYRPGIPMLIGAASDTYNHMRLSALSLADLTLDFLFPF
jgi:hypothetical protein